MGENVAVAGNLTTTLEIAAQRLLSGTVHDAAETMSDPADLISRAHDDAAVLDALLIKAAQPPDAAFNRLKQAPGPATPKTIRLWVERLAWLNGLIDPDPPLESIAHTKLRQFPAEAAGMEVSDLLDIAQLGRRHTLLLALLRQSCIRCRDELIEMMLRRIRRTQAAAKERLDALHDQ